MGDDDRLERGASDDQGERAQLDMASGTGILGSVATSNTDAVALDAAISNNAALDVAISNNAALDVAISSSESVPDVTVSGTGVLISAVTSHTNAVAPAETVPPAGRVLRSHPPPKPVAHRPEPSQPAFAASPAPTGLATSVTGSEKAAPEERTGGVSVWIAIGVAAVAAAFFAGIAVGRPSVHSAADAAASTQSAIETARAAAFAAGKASQPAPAAVFDLRTPPGTRPAAVTLNAEPATRSMSDVIALGRTWDRERLDGFGKFIERIRRTPAELEDTLARTEVLDYVTDRSTSRVMLESLAELAHPRAPDLLYEVWTGSKDRNETTQLAEALLLVPEVRKRASAALELALALREKPAACEEVSRLVALATREGDRRSAMPLVNTSARTTCGPSGDVDCVKCLKDPKEMRKAIHAVAARPDPVR